MKQIIGMKWKRDKYETGTRQTARQRRGKGLRGNRAETGAENRS